MHWVLWNIYCNPNIDMLWKMGVKVSFTICWYKQFIDWQGSKCAKYIFPKPWIFLKLTQFKTLFHKLSYHLRQLYSSVPPPFRNCCTILALPISSEIIDGFWHSRCLNDSIILFYMIGSFASGANVSLGPKMELKKWFHYCW